MLYNMRLSVYIIALGLLGWLKEIIMGWTYNMDARKNKLTQIFQRKPLSSHSLENKEDNIKTCLRRVHWYTVHMWCSFVSPVFCCSCVVTLSLYWRMLLCSLRDLYCAFCSVEFISNICIMMRNKHVTYGTHGQGARNPKNPL
jgi:hypothetical protein